MMNTAQGQVGQPDVNGRSEARALFKINTGCKQLSKHQFTSEQTNHNNPPSSHDGSEDRASVCLCSLAAAAHHMRGEGSLQARATSELRHNENRGGQEPLWKFTSRAAL